MKYGYVRISTKGQLDGNSIQYQIEKITGLYPDAKIITETFSGAKDRPIFNELIDSLESEDVLVVTKLDRFCRTTKEGLQFIDALINKGVKIHILNMGLIEDTPMGRLIITNLLAFAEFERAMIIERTQSGKAIARTKNGFKDGRPKKFNPLQIQNAIRLLEEGNSYATVSETTQMSKSTLIRAMRENDKM